MKKFFACMLACLMLVSALPVSAEWTDADELDYVEAIDPLLAANILTGYGGYPAPASSITRADAAWMIYRFVTGESPADAWIEQSEFASGPLSYTAHTAFGAMLDRLRNLGYGLIGAEFGVVAREEAASPIQPGLELEFLPHSLTLENGFDVDTGKIGVDLTDTNWAQIEIDGPIVATDVQVKVSFTAQKSKLPSRVQEIIEEEFNNSLDVTLLRTAFTLNGKPAASVYASLPSASYGTFSLAPQSEGDDVYFEVSFSLLEHAHAGGHWAHDEDGHWYVGCTNGFGSCDGYIKYAHEGSGCVCGYAPRGFFGMGTIFPLVYRLRFETNGGSAIATQLRMLSNKVDLSRFVPVREGYTFVGWFFDAALEQPVDGVFRMRGNRTVYAGWAAIVAEEPDDAVGEDAVTE